MSFENTEPMTLTICMDCVGHLANGECGTCHSDPFLSRYAGRHGVQREDYTCVAGTRIDRAMTRRFAGAHITLGCTDEECSDCRNEGGESSWFSMSSCDLCGDTDGGDREHATAWIVPNRRVTRTMRSGATVTYNPDTFGQLMVNYRGAWKWFGVYREGFGTTSETTPGKCRYLILANYKRETMGV